MQQNLLTEEQKMFREAVKEFLTRDVMPHHEKWEEEGIVSREVWEKAGENGFLCMDVPEEYGGMGESDYRYLALLAHEMGYAGAHGPGYIIQNELVVPYLMAFGNEDQKQKYLPKMATGELITALAMTEPNTGSDLQGIKSTAIKNGDHYVLNGQKTFISNGILSDMVIVACKTDPEQGARGMSLLLVEREMEGFERGRNLEKMGLHAQDTAELYFKDVKVPVENLLGEEGKGFYYLMHNLPQERLSIAISAQAGAERILDETTAYCQERTAFGKPIGKFQNSRFKLAEMKTEVVIGRAFVDRCIDLLTKKELSTEEASMAKWWCSDMGKRVADECVQLHGGYGYMTEYAVAKFYTDMRIHPIYGGTNEIMKEIIGRGMGF
ncbi:MAG: acyl-CoA dehydrogenase family protein [Chloroflexota bacterium]